MKHAHTAGPWKANLQEPYHLVIEDPEGDGLAQVYLGDAPVHEYNDRQFANARLFAIAPTAPHDCDVPGCPGPRNKALIEMAGELLEALVAIRTIGQKLGPDYFSLEHDLIRRRADAAIAKAQDAKVGEAK